MKALNVNTFEVHATVYTQVLKFPSYIDFCHKLIHRSPLGRGRGGLVMALLVNPPRPTGTPPRRGFFLNLCTPLGGTGE
jgi:hypothetical protein